ncbi:hypothetical protein MTR67_052284 [Solanum verrucosum]|uniref:Reverse transcriptase zinc-binding domain-containing protein n=1 Tax=Solanum verrucosum TaxID=315347 RepID=A0AAF0V7Q4_SOLVR|nr:hypothetical protein MTR67_052284 [Solanum verrucosum]
MNGMRKVTWKLFSLIFTIWQCSDKELWTPQGWNFIFRREPNDWEVMRLAEFLNLVGNFTGLQAYEDMLWWKGNNRGEFKVHSAYRLMDQSSQQSPIWPWKQIWKCRIPHKVSCFIWLLAKEAALTQDNLWRIFLSLKGISWTMPRRVTEALYSWEEAENSQLANARFQAAGAIRDAALREWVFLEIDDKRGLIRWRTEKRGEILKGDVMATIRNFHSQEDFEKSLNATYIALVPKKNGANKLKDFRPISLIGSVYKLISKILLTKRLKKVMPKLVDTQQMAFLKERQIIDAVLIANEYNSQLKYLRVILILFEAISGLHINWRKSFIFPVNEVPRISMLANILGGKIGDLPTTYLGMPLGDKSSEVGPSHSQQKGRRFGDKESENPESKLTYEVVMEICLTRTGSLEGNNKARFGMENLWITNLSTQPYGSGVLRSIRNLWIKFFNKCKIKVGNGGRTLFWEDKWVDQVTLRNRFPILFNMILQKEATIREMRDNQGWDPRFRRHLNDWEVNKIVELLNILGQYKDLNTDEDNLFWNPDEQDRFSVGSAYRSSQRPGTHIGGWPWKMIWKVKIPLKIACFTWLLANQAALTQHNLMKRGMQICSRCWFCECEVETINHLFLHCREDAKLWQIFINLRGISWTMPRNIKEALACWNRDGNQSGHRERWKIVPACIWWSIWMERNQRCFKNKSCSMQNLKLNCIVLFFFWCKHEYPQDAEDIPSILEFL